MATKPFSPKEVEKMMGSLQTPAVFLKMTCDWPVLRWTVDHLSCCYGKKAIRFRLGRKQETNTPLFETQCSYVEANLREFLCWSNGQTGVHVGPFSDYPHSEYWAYADYKYIALLFQDKPSMFEEVMWSEFGFPGRNGRDSTLWIGTEGANTVCHQDSYGCNLVLQVQGRKRWHLFPPEDCSCLYPTRIPYEESSVFSLVDVLQPDLRTFPAFRQARPHVVTLEPGQVLFVPRHWWHYVESLDPVTVSVNTWVELETDDEARVGEAITKAVVCALKTTSSRDNADNWLNPTEEGVESHDENLEYLNQAVQACQTPRCDKQTQHSANARPAKRDSRGQAKQSSNSAEDSSSSSSLTVPYGPHLIPVLCEKNNKNNNKPTREQSSKDRPSEDSDRVAEPFCGGRKTGDNTQDEGDTEGSGHTPITTNDLLECLVHPDVIALVTQLLMERAREREDTT